MYLTTGFLTDNMFRTLTFHGRWQDQKTELQTELFNKVWTEIRAYALLQKEFIITLFKELTPYPLSTATPAFHSPEMRCKRPSYCAEPATVWQLGGMLYEMITWDSPESILDHRLSSCKADPGKLSPFVECLQMILVLMHLRTSHSCYF